MRNKAAHFDRSGRGFDVLFDSDATADQAIAFAKLYYSNITVPTRHPSFLRQLFISTGRLLSARLMTRLGEVAPSQPCKSAKEKANDIRERVKNSEFYKEFEKAIELFKRGDSSELDTIVDTIIAVLKTPESMSRQSADLAILILGEIDSLKQTSNNFNKESDSPSNLKI